jgi:hypothetical protein
MARGPCHEVACCDKIEVISQERRRADAMAVVFNTGHHWRRRFCDKRARDLEARTETLVSFKPGYMCSYMRAGAKL